MQEDDWNNSECADGWLHRYLITGQDENYVEETCTICGNQVYFKIVNGKSNNDVYLASHIRQVLFPGHPLFMREFSSYQLKKGTSIND